jgi:hypothetical protein
MASVPENFDKVPPRQGAPIGLGNFPMDQMIDDLATLTTMLVRERYIQQVAQLIPATWRDMSAMELTQLLRSTYTEAQLQDMFLAKHADREALKTLFRKANVVAAIVLGLIWARENIQDGNWEKAIAKVGTSGLTAYAVSKFASTFDRAATQIMADKAGQFGRWFQGAARTNRYVNFLTRRVGGALAIWDLKDFLMSGGYGGPNIPFDFIVEIDIDDPSTWKEPDAGDLAMLDIGFNLWYKQKRTPAYPGDSAIYLGKIEGSVFRVLDMAPHEVPQMKDRLYRIEGQWGEVDLFIVSKPGRIITAFDNVLVYATGRRSGQLISGGHGHYRELEVKPWNSAAVRLFGNEKPQFVPEYLLRSISGR